MRKVAVLFVFLLVCTGVYAQGEANMWYFGNKAGLDFNSGSPVALTDGQMHAYEGCASISNAAGQLLMYTDGIKVWNKMHTVMPNGTGLLGHSSSTQAAVIVPKPGSATIYYIFTSTDLAHANGLRYTEVDMSLNGGLGAVTSNKNILLMTPSCEKITVVKNANGVDFWVMTHGINNNNYHAYKVTAAGVNVTPVTTSIGDVYNLSINEAVGYLKFSPDGTKLLNAAFYHGLFLYDFNLSTGVLSNEKRVNSKFIQYGAEFSPSGNVAYFTGGDVNIFELIQYDLTAANIEASANLIYQVNDVNHQVGALQLAVDSKIYMPIYDSDYISVINNPEVLGSGCNLVVNAVNLGTGLGQSGLPQFIQSYFQTDIKAVSLCLGSTTNFSLANNQNVSSAVWDFGDGSPTQSGLNVTHNYNSSGVFTVTTTITTTTGVVTKTKQITIAAVPVIANVVSNQSVCGTANMTYDLSQFNATLLGSQSTAVFGVSYFSSLADATNHANALPNIQNLPLGATTFYAKVYNIINTSCNAITSFSVTLSQQPIATQPTDYIICENAPNDNMEQFDLSTKNNQVLNGQNPAGFAITYHASLANANNDIGALPNLYTNTQPQETLYVRIENVNNPNCFAVTTLVIKVIQQLIISPVSNFMICDDASNDGIATFNLALKTPEILNGQSPSNFVVKYYYSINEAQNGINEITAPISNTVSNQVIYYSISSIGNDNCKSVSNFNLIVSKLPKANAVSAMFICDDITNDEVGVFNLTNNNPSVLGTQNSGEFTISYHSSQNDADNGINPLPNNYQNTSNTQTIFVRIENNLNPTCFSTTTFPIGLHKMPIANKPQDLFACTDGVSYNFNLASQDSTVLGTQLPSEFTVSYHLSQTDANSGNNPLGNNYANISSPQTIYVRIANKLSASCYDTTDFQIIAKQKPVLNMTDVYSICQGSSITINAPTGFSSYLWSNGDTNPYTTLTLDGNYYLTVTQNYGGIICDTTQNFVVYNSNIATIKTIKISDWTTNQNTIEIFVTGDGDYEFSIDGTNYQNSPVFTQLSSGEYTVYVRDKKGCGVASDTIYLLMYPKFFTPNADGYNDYWNIENANFEPELKISIFDRFGKLLKTFTGNDKGWNGFFNGKALPSSDYWFVVKRKDGKEYKGHFTLKR